MLDTPKRNQEHEAVGELGFLMTSIEQEAVPASLTKLAEQLADALDARSISDAEPA